MAWKISSSVHVAFVSHYPDTASYVRLVLQLIIRRLAWYRSCITEIRTVIKKDDINVICELLAENHGDLELDLFSNSVLDAFIEVLWTKINFYCAVIFVYTCTIFIIK